MGGMCKPVSERFDLPRKNSQVLPSTNNREKDARMNASSETWQLGNQSVQVTHLEKVYWPQVGFTKGDVLHFYRQIATVALPLPLIDTVGGLLWFANQGAFEFHLWGSHLPDLTQPDLAIFDLDPGETASFDAVREAGLRLHDALAQAGMRGYPKTNGGG